VLAADAGRLRVFEVLASSCLYLPVRLLELASFFEEVCGHVPAREINAAWFQHVVHPRYRAGVSASKRAFDLVAVAVLGLPFLLIVAAVAPFIRRDGGPVFFWQTRIGEGGRELRICKLRTMRVGCSAHWASPDDPRVTPLGRILRRTHVDELPQLLNILRGEMTLVGPRPEQPQFVERAEDMIPFYQRRHLLRPGLTGWAQVRCGYAGSDVGSAWKLCHDLYYLKHRSLGFDIAILLETARTLLLRQSRLADPPGRGFVVPQPAPVLEPVSVGHA
jgi:lipopolysaccharide/colanic/teichoic acid biosynthesis glycosyltransferase